MFLKGSFKSIATDDSKENGLLSARSKAGSIRYGEGDDESQGNTGIMTQRSSLLDIESIKFNQRSESTPQSHFQTRASNFTGALATSRQGSLIILDLEDAQAIIDKLDNSKELVKAFDAYQPKNCDIDIIALRKSEKSKIKKYKTSVYLGEFQNGKRHGKGIMIFTPLKVYEGDWSNDLKHGKGLEILEKGSRYEGNYANGKPDGYGKFIWGNGEFYEGEWKNGLKHGSGTWKGTKGESYIGEWRYGKAEGYGVHTWKNGDKYEGEFKCFMKHGHGKEKFANGDYYEGDYVDGKPEGFGEFFWANGCHYKGDFKEGLRHGKGSWTKGTGKAEHYEGDWANDKKNGTGVYTWVSGNKYMGTYVDDIRHGYGEMYWTDGGLYKGFWERGIQHGEGQVYLPGKINKRGIFERNTMIDNIAGGATENDALNKNEDVSPMFTKANSKHTAEILVTPRGVLQTKPLIKNWNKINEYSSNEQNRITESYLPEIRTVRGGNNTSLTIPSPSTRSNSSSRGPLKFKKDSVIIKLEEQNMSAKLTDQHEAKKIKNLKSLVMNDQLKRVSPMTKVK